MDTEQLGCSVRATPRDREGTCGCRGPGGPWVTLPGSVLRASRGPVV